MFFPAANLLTPYSSVCPSVCPNDRQQRRLSVGLLLQAGLLLSFRPVQQILTDTAASVALQLQAGLLLSARPECSRF